MKITNHKNERSSLYFLQTFAVISVNTTSSFTVEVKSKKLIKDFFYLRNNSYRVKTKKATQIKGYLVFKNLVID